MKLVEETQDLRTLAWCDKYAQSRIVASGCHPEAYKYAQYAETQLLHALHDYATHTYHYRVEHE